VIDACERCLRRAALVAALAPRIERVATRGGRSQARQILALGDQALTAAMGLDSSPLRDGAAADVAGAVEAAGGWAICRHAPAYPVPLADLGDERPAVLFGLGRRELLTEAAADAPPITIVGARRASSYGRATAYALALPLAGAGLPAVSGMASGVDVAAHRGALDAAGPTIAVLGTGVDVPYPSGERTTYERVVRSGAVVSEMPPGSRPYRWTFPARNRIMAALGAMTVVVEAARRSGSLITAEMAQDLAREVGAVPGRVDGRLAAGPNGLLADGAVLVRDAQDILDAVLGPGHATARDASEPAPALDPELDRVLAAVEGGAATPDEVAAATSLGAGTVAAALARLEVLGRVACGVGGRFAPAGPR
jgi:DNA processing protein